MARNVEIKARVRDVHAIRERIERLSETPGATLAQEDTFFLLPEARVKLRVFPDGRGELIAYKRLDRAGPTESRYFVLPTDNPAGLKSFLSDALGIRGVVRKKRLLYSVGQTRIHLDEVEGLGTFVELEVVLGDGQPVEDGERIAEEIFHLLGISEDDRVEIAYIDLLEETR